MMKRISLFALLALLDAGPAMAVDYAGTNQMPEPVHALMETAGYGRIQTNLDFPVPVTNSLRNLPPIAESWLVTLRPPTLKTGWSLWNNTSIKYAGNTNEPANIFTPASFPLYSALFQFEYDINYSFEF